MYISENIACNLKLSTDILFECIFNESLVDTTFISCVYKLPDSDVSSFTSEFDNLLTAIN